MLHTKFRSSDFYFLVTESFIRFSFPCFLKAFIQNLVQIATVVYEKIQFEFLYVHDLGGWGKVKK